MTGDRATSVRQSANRQIPQFAPNFSVYLLPPDVVCLYSEDRKFFLHGELYCALASLIGEGGRTFAELARELGQNFPPDKIDEALKRLVDRRFILPSSPSSEGVVAAYWASLGLSPETAAANLQKCRVRIQSLDVQGATELGDALTGLGVRVVKRSPTSRSHWWRLSRFTAGRAEQPASVRPYVMVARATVRHFSSCWSRAPPRRERLLDVSLGSHDAQPRDQRDA